MTPVLALDRVRAGYGGIDTLHGIDLHVGAGEVLALLGPNGAGKSTTLRVMSGLVTPSSGSVSLMGREVNGVRPDRLARAGICLVPEHRGVFPNLSVRENLAMFAHATNRADDIEQMAYDLFPRLAERRNHPARTLSGGEQQMLALSRAITTAPAVLLLDELSMGLAPMIVEDLYQRVAELAESGTSIVIVEQFAKPILDIAHRAALLINGRVTGVGAPATIAEKLSDAYLGS